MTPEHFRTIREGLGMQGTELADHLNVSDRTIRRWEAGSQPIGDWVTPKLDALMKAADNEVSAITARLGRHRPILTIERSGWDRAIAFRVLQQIPQLTITSDADGIS